MFRTPLSLDRYNLVSTAILSAILAGAVVVTWMTGVLVAALFGGALVAASAVVFAMSPRALVGARDEVRIERRLWLPLRIARVEISQASTLKSLGRGIVRVGGVGGFFGSFGLFRSADLGTFRLYATRAGHALRIERGEAMPIVVTPDDVQGALAAIEAPPDAGAYR